jgi:hypothetical protein
MKKAAFITVASLALLVGHAIPSHASHFRGGIYIGPLWGPMLWGPVYRYPYPAYSYSPPPVVVRQEPEEYLAPQPQPQQQALYYCPDPKGYYPYVKQCPKGWQKVTPTPPAPQAEAPDDQE